MAASRSTVASTIGVDGDWFHVGMNGICRVLVGLLTGLAIWLIYRRSQGAFAQPLSLVGACLLGCVIFCVLVGIIRTGRAAVEPAPLRLTGCWEIVWGLAAVVVIALMLSLPGSRPSTLAAIWSSVALGIIAAVGMDGGQRSRPAGLRSRPALERTPTGEDDGDATLPPNVSQQILRGTSEVDAPFVAGKARVPIAAGQKVAHCHVAICPPLEQPIEFSVEPVEGPAAAAEVGMVLPNGVRFDLRLQQIVDADSEVVIEFYGG